MSTSSSAATNPALTLGAPDAQVAPAMLGASAPETSRDGTRSRAATLTLFTALSLTCYMDRFIMGALLTPVKLDLRLTDEQVGRIEAAFNLAYVIGVPIFGLLGDRLPRKHILLLGLLLWSIASIGGGFAGTLGTLILWRALVGFGESNFNAVAPTWLADSFAARVRNLAFAVFNSASKTGATIGVAVGGYLAARYNWHVAFWAAGVPGLLLAIGLLVAREPRRGQSEATPKPFTAPSLRDSLSVLKRPEFVGYAVGYTAYMVAISTMFYWGPAYYHRTFGVTNLVATGYFGLGYTTMGLPGALLGGWVGTLWFRRDPSGYARVLALAMVLVAPVLVAALTTRDGALFRALIWTEMVLFGLCSATVTSLLFETVTVTQRGAGLAVSLLASSGIGGVAASSGIGALSDHFGLHRALFVSPAAALLASAAWWYVARRQRRK